MLIHLGDCHPTRLDELDKTTELSIETIQFTEQVAGVQRSLELESKSSDLAVGQGPSEHIWVTGMGFGTKQI